jgi:Xaa-Pro aminopeptidase
MVLVKIPEKIYKKRQRELKEELHSYEMDGMIIFNPVSIFWLTGFHHIATERPLALVFPVDSELSYFIPALETDHLSLRYPDTPLMIYFEYPGKEHPMTHFIAHLESEQLTTKVLAADSLSFSARWGYEGPSLDSVLPELDIKLVPELIPNKRKIKCNEEIELIKESARWGNLAHTLLFEYTQPGLRETEVSMEASMEASLVMLKTLGPAYEPYSWSGGFPASAGYRGQIGEWSAIPHSLDRNAIFKEGDVLVTGASANVGSYISELERTFIIGEPTEKQKKYFEVMLKSQQAALDTFGPGIKCSEVDQAAIDVVEKAGLSHLLRHHTGHALGLEVHEAPFIDLGDYTVMQEGMVFSCEPGIYELGFAGFRHSDTVIITSKGAEIITYFPRELDELIIR